MTLDVLGLYSDSLIQGEEGRAPYRRLCDAADCALARGAEVA
jgi:hypothetical protein